MRRLRKCRVKVLVQSGLRKSHELAVPCSIYTYDFLVRLMRLPAAKKGTFILILALLSLTAQLLRPQHDCGKPHALGKTSQAFRAPTSKPRVYLTSYQWILSLRIIILTHKDISPPAMKQNSDRAAVPCTVFIQRHGCNDLFSGNLRAVFGLNTRIRCTSRCAHKHINVHILCHILDNLTAFCRNFRSS